VPRGDVDDMTHRSLPQRAVDVLRGTEAAAPPAAPCDLDQEHVAELGVGCQHPRAGLPAVERHCGLPLHGCRCTHGRRDLGDAAVVLIGDPVSGRQVDPWHGGQGVEGRPPPAHMSGQRLHQRIQYRLDLTDQKSVKEVRQGLGVQRSAGSAGDHHGIAAAALGRCHGDAAQVEHGDRIGVVQFVAEREGDHIELAQRGLRFQRRERAPRPREHPLLAGIWPEGPLADDVETVIEQTIDGMHAEIGHADMIGVGIDQGDPEFATVVLANGSHFAGKPLLRPAPLGTGAHFS